MRARVPATGRLTPNMPCHDTDWLPKMPKSGNQLYSEHTELRAVKGEKGNSEKALTQVEDANGGLHPCEP